MKFRFAGDEPHYIANPVNRVVDVDEVFEVDDEDAHMFSQSPDRFKPVDNPAKKAVAAEKKES